MLLLGFARLKIRLLRGHIYLRQYTINGRSVLIKCPVCWSFGFDSQRRGTRENRRTLLKHRVPLGSHEKLCIRYCSNKHTHTHHHDHHGRPFLEFEVGISVTHGFWVTTVCVECLFSRSPSQAPYGNHLRASAPKGQPTRTPPQ